MDDRELLELAAKAAGIAHDGAGYVHENGLPMNWNPLTDDGDALRLAVTLELDLNLGQCGTIVYMKRCTPNVEEYSEAFMTACRRAIVRAAAEIGRSMP